MNRSLFRGIAIAVALVAGLAFWPSGSPTSPSPVFAGGIGVANDQVETVFTSSPDGKTIYMWQYFSSKPPKYLGKSEAILPEN